MESSSVSQESLDINDDYELNARRTRIRTQRARGAFHKTGDHESETSGDREGWDINGDESSPPLSTQTGGTLPGDGVLHDSPSRTSAIQRAKDKRARPNHLQKGKLPKDKRKLREKRRSTGVVQNYLATNESTGDSLDDDDEEEKVLTEAKRNTTYNEVIDDDNPQTPSEVKSRIQQFQSQNLTSNNKSNPDKITSAKLMAPKGFVARRNKSPSDLEADLEDNQDYDSAVSQSDSSFPFTNQSTTKDTTINHNHKPTPWSNQSKVNTYSPTKFKPMATQFEDGPSSVTSSTNNNRNTFGSKSASSYQTSHGSSIPPRQSSYESDRSPSYASSQMAKNVQLSPNAPRSTKPVTSAATTTTNHDAPTRHVSSVLSRYNEGRTEEIGGYRSRFRDREFGGVRGPVGQQFAASLLNKENKDDDVARRKLEKDLERERDENQRLRGVLEEKDRLIADLQRQVAMMDRDLEDMCDDMDKLHAENRALVTAIGQLSGEGRHGSSTHV